MGMAPHGRPSDYAAGGARGLSLFLTGGKVVLEEEITQLFNNNPAVPFVDRPLWCTVVALEAAANLVVLGLEVDLVCVHSCQAADFLPWRVLDYSFTAFGVLEVIVAMVTLGPKVYFRGDRTIIPVALVSNLPIHLFRCLDFTLVMSRLLDVAVLRPLHINAELRFLSLLRIMHVGRFMMRVKSIAAFHELALIMQGLGEIMRCVAFVTVLMLLLLWVFAVVVTITAGKVDAALFDFSRGTWRKDDYWGTVPKSMLSLFQVATRDGWSDTLVRPLVQKDWGMALIFAIFLVIALLALLSTIVGVVVESTLASARANVEKKGIEKHKLEGLVMRSLEQIFRAADTDGSGDLNRDELRVALNKSSVKSRMKLVGISMGDLDLLFSLLDDEDTGVIKTGNFFKSCIRLCGPAMARDLCQLQVDFERQTGLLTHLNKSVKTVNDQLSSLIDMFDSIDRDVVKDASDVKDPVLQARRARAEVTSRALQLRRAVGDMGSSMSMSEMDVAMKASETYGRNMREDSEQVVQPPWGHMQPPPPEIPSHLVIRP